MQTTHDLLVGTLSIGIPSIIGIAQKTFICQIICIPSSTFKISAKMHECLTEFRFKKADIPRLARALQIPDVIRCYQGTIATGLNISFKSVGIELI